MLVATYGSCFAQHFSRRLVESGYSWIDAEPAPPGLNSEEAKRSNYGVFSARTGNIYSAAALRQWMSWADGSLEPSGEVWEKAGRFFDPFRPAIEPDGFETAQAVHDSRAATARSFGQSVRDAALFVFTMGLTESWINADDGAVYAVCPGTVAGEFDPKQHKFVNYGFAQTVADMAAALGQIRALNPSIRVLITVSPVPLTATASGEHVLTATTYSKSVLRAVAGELKNTFEYVDYFPSYEIITAPPFRGDFFEPNMRSVSAFGVDFVMNSFFRTLGHLPSDDATEAPAAIDQDLREEAEDALVCEEEMLDAPAVQRVKGATTTIGFVGNSHLAALRRSLVGGKTQPADVDFAFWGVPGEFGDITLSDGVLTHPNSQKLRRVNGPGCDTFELSKLDGLVLVAEPVALPIFIRHLRTETPPLCRADASVLAAELKRWCDARLGMRVLLEARQLLTGPIVAVQQPMWRAGSRRGSRLWPLTEDQFSGLTDATTAMFADLGIIYVNQPRKTLDASFKTRDAYSMAHTKGLAGDPMEDHAHMSPLYGDLVLDKIYAVLADHSAK